MDDDVADIVSGGAAGSPMPTMVRRDMEHRFGADFGGVRLHTDKAAAESADGLNAKAYTIGNDIVFNTGQFAPAQHDGHWLLDHELAHVVQQSRGGEAPRLDPRAANEQAANVAAVQSTTGAGPIAVGGSSGVGIAREIDDEEPAPREETQGRLVTIEVIDTNPEISAEIRSVLEGEYVPTPAQAKELKGRDPNFNFSGRASIDRGNAYERTIRDAINSGELSHPLLSRERGVPRATVAPAHGDPFERELTRGQRAQGRILDVGWSVEVTVEGGSTGFLSQNKLTQIARDLRNSGESVVIVPEMTPGIERQLAELTTKAESAIGGEPRVHVLIVNGAPPEPWALPETPAPVAPAPATPPSSAASPKPVFAAPEPIPPKPAEPTKPLAPPAAPKQAAPNPNVIVEEQERGAGAAAGALEIANLGIKTTQETKAHQVARRDSALRTW